MFRPIVVLKLGTPRENGGDVLGCSADPSVLGIVKAALIEQAEERQNEATELGDETLAFVESERAASLRRLLDCLIPTRGSGDLAPSVHTRYQ
jgi:hypothetical protein